MTRQATLKIPRSTDGDLAPPPAGADRFVPGPGAHRRLRDAFGRFATGVSIVTANSAIGPLGMTANSFSSLSMDPPLVLWAPARKSRRFAAFAEAPHFAIHILARDQRAMALHFSTQGHDFAGFDTVKSVTGVPLLAGCLAIFECTLEAVHDGGDHAIVVGRVQAVQTAEGAPLVFGSGRFGGFDPHLVDTHRPR